MKHCPILVSVKWKSSGYWRDVIIWLLDNVPNHNHYQLLGCTTADKTLRTVGFRNEKDAMLFTLRWL